MRIVGIVFLVSLAVPFLAAQLTREDWSRADETVVRLKPDAFPNLPDHVRVALAQRGCTIPQPYPAGAEKKNVLSGHFVSSGTADWAVLCSHRRRSSILIFRGHSARVDSIGDEPDSQYLQVVDEGRKIGYSRLLTVATAKQVRKHFAHANHDAILDSFTGKASLLWYSSGGKWMKVPAGD
ncbi:MAG TPA: hypothetical protein VJV96_12310 [Candidatus Angelobacter sp.]|nr:hypothetical protein [Candidatus Angelobacter sp.]